MTAVSEDNTGLRALLSLAPVYRAAQRAIGADRFRATVADEIIAATGVDRVLDIGCGTADILDHLPDLDYVGFDPNPRYVDDAADRFGSRGTFLTGGSGGVDQLPTDRTIALAIGVLHHMDDDLVRSTLDLAAASLEPGGRLVTIDPTLVDGQHRIARFLAGRDRGQHVRSPDQVRELVAASFEDFEVSVRHDLLRVPYSHVLVRAVR